MAINERFVRAVIMNLEGWMQASKMPEDALDTLVHDAKAAEASEINNGGWEVQLTYLLGGYNLKHFADIDRAVAALQMMIRDAAQQGE